MIRLRDYQSRAIDRLYKWFEVGAGHPLVVAPTGSGKSVMLGAFSQRACTEYPGTRVLIVTHVKELVEQNFVRLKAIWPQANAGIYAAGVGRRDIGNQVTVASIQSIYKRALQLGRYDLILVDEAHLISPKREGMYRRFLGDSARINPHIKVIGWTATPYRLRQGMLFEGEGALFDGVAHEIAIRELLDAGHLCPLTTEPVRTRTRTGHVGTRQGEYITSELAAAVDVAGITHAAVREIVELGRDRKAWLIFAVTIRHAEHVREALLGYGINTAIVTGKTPKGERERTLVAYKQGRIRALVNVDVLTTGFDYPGIGLVAFLRPTLSPGLYLQMTGRGMRTAPGKADCIAEGQRVLTDCGLVPIEHVTEDMKVWDGVEFVPHAGAICKGEKNVITYAGITATVDHRVWTKEGWKALGQCAVEQTPVSVTGIGGVPIREAEGRFRRGRAQEETWKGAFTRRVRGLRSAIVEGLHKRGEGHSGVSVLWQPTLCTEMAGHARNRSQTEMHESERSGVREVRRARGSIQIRFANQDGDMGRGESWPTESNAVGQNQQQRSLRTGQPSLREGTSKSVEYKEAPCERSNARVQSGISEHTIRGQHTTAPNSRRSFIRANRREVQTSLVQTKRRVWDILNAGPRNRFTAEGVLVHNCLVLDFAGNIDRHGPIDDVRPPRAPSKRTGGGGAVEKICPDCELSVHARAPLCPHCGYQFPARPAHEATASDAEILSGGRAPEPEIVDVTDVRYARHQKPGKPPSLRVDYYAGINLVAREWVCLEHGGYAREKARCWWSVRFRAGANHKTPCSVSEALERVDELIKPDRLYLCRRGRFLDVVRVEFDKEPA